MGPEFGLPLSCPSPTSHLLSLHKLDGKIQVDCTCPRCLAQPPARMAVEPHLLCPSPVLCCMCSRKRENKEEGKKSQGPEEAATCSRAHSYLVAHTDPSSQAGFLYSQGQRDRRWAASLGTQSSPLPFPPSHPPCIPSLITSKASFPLPFSPS